MERFGGFEGNAQSLRLITEMFYGRMKDKTGMMPTRAFVDAILKYKVIYDIGKKKPKTNFLYPEQRKYLDFVFRGSNWRAHLGHLPTSIECQIMHWADNVAYSIDDLKDAAMAGFISSRTIGNWVGGQSNLAAKAKDRLNELGETVDGGTFHPHLSKRMGDFVRAVSLQRVRGFMSRQTNRYAFNLEVQDDIQQEYEAYSDLAVAVVFSSAKLQQLEFKADQVLRKLFYSLQANYEGKTKTHLLPEDWHSYIVTLKTKAERARTICDFLAGMTDSFAGRYFQRFFLPEYGSLTDLV